MAVYTVHVPPAAPGVAPSPERVVFLRDGFSSFAFVFGPLWLLWRRAWLPAVLWTALMAAAFGGGAALGLNAEAASVLQLASGALLGFEGSRLVAWSLERKGFVESAILVADDRDEAEDAFFANWRPAGVVRTTGVTTAGDGVTTTASVVVGSFEEPRP